MHEFAFMGPRLSHSEKAESNRDRVKGLSDCTSSNLLVLGPDDSILMGEKRDLQSRHRCSPTDIAPKFWLRWIICRCSTRVDS